ncbi:MAG: type II secretion system protein GspM [Alphaproteobacteria bacterium]
MILQPGTWISRTVALALLALTLLALHRFVAAPLLERFASNEQRIQQMSDLVKRYRDLEATRPALAERLAEIEGLDAATSGYWEGESDIQTAAELQDRASEAVEAAGGDVISLQSLDPALVEGGLPIRRTLLRLRLATSVEGLAGTVHDIESAVPYMFIDQLIVTPQRSRQYINRSSEHADQEEKLDVRLDVFGYARTPPGSTESADGADAES